MHCALVVFAARMPATPLPSISNANLWLLVKGVPGFICRAATAAKASLQFEGKLRQGAHWPRLQPIIAAAAECGKVLTGRDCSHPHPGQL